MVNFSFPPGVLTQQGPGPQYMMGQPVLTQGQRTPSTPALSGAAMTGNRRQSTRMPAIPNNQMPFNEMMMRAGAAMTSAAMDSNGGDIMGDMFRSYADSQDYNRRADMERYQLEEERRLEALRRQDLLRKLNAKGKKKDEKTPQEAANEIARLEGILNDLKTDPNLTGPIAGGIGHQYDRSGLGDPSRAAKRLILAELQVNATLAYTAQTKGAITDREMALFAKPVPQLTDDEQMWIDWLEPQLEILKQLQRNGITDEAAKQQGIKPSNSSPTSSDMSVDDLVNQYAPQN